MIGLQMTMKGLPELIESLDGKHIINANKETIADVCEYAYELAMGFCPKDTGELAESIYKECRDDSFEIGADAPHAIFNEYGSITTPIGNVNAPKAAKKTGVRPFIRPALYRAVAEYETVFFKKYAEKTNFRVG